MNEQQLNTLIEKGIQIHVTVEPRKDRHSNYFLEECSKNIAMGLFFAGLFIGLGIWFGVGGN